MTDKPFILVADDDELLQTILEHKLKRAGYEVLCVSNGREAMSALERRRPAALVLDAMMPIMDGFEVLRRIRADRSSYTLPVIMLSALKGESDIVDALQIGASDYLVKPFIPDELIIRLSRMALKPPGAGAAAA
jgi:DNA-binding response OmpR family regulator